MNTGTFSSPPPPDDWTAPAPANFPSYKPASTRNHPRFHNAAHRQMGAQAFQSGAAAYADIRPGYPPEIAALVADCDTVVDIGAGTGKLTQCLRNRCVLAIEPSADMCRVLRQQLQMPVWRATAEATALPPHSADAAILAQTWHWVDVAAASAELDRVIKPGGKVVLVWNTIDATAADWVLRLIRIMHSGDIHKPGFYPDVAPPWQITEELRLTWRDPLTPAQLHQLMHTRSYWLRANRNTRARMTHNLNWYLNEYLNCDPAIPLELPYRTDAFVLTRH